MKKTFFIAAIIALFILPIKQINAQSTRKNTMETQKPKHRIVVQYSTPDTLAPKGLINNLTNLLSELPDSQIAVVFHGPGLDVLLKDKSKYINLLEELSKKGIEFFACENTLRARKLDKSALLPFAQTVPSGVAAVVLKQEAGWSYLKGGY